MIKEKTTPHLAKVVFSFLSCILYPELVTIVTVLGTKKGYF